MIHLLSFFLVACSFIAFANDSNSESVVLGSVVSQQTQQDILKGDFRKKNPCIRAIVLIANEDCMPARLSETNREGVYVHLDSLECIDNLVDALSVYLQQPLDEKILCQIEQTILSYYYSIRYPFILIEFPNQNISNGILHIVVRESTIGEICIESNEDYAIHKIMDYMRLCPGERINESILFNDVAWLNRNPFRQIDIVYRPGYEEDTTDILLRTHARRRFRLYGGVNNTGVKSIQRERFFAGFNLTNYQQMLTYQYNSSFNTKRFQAHTLQYTLPCAWRNVLNIYGGYARVRPELSLPATRNEGWSMQMSLRYVIPFKTYSHLTHEMSIGGDFKRTNNTVEFSDNSPTIANNVNLTQAMLEYKGAYSSNRNRIDYQIQGFCSPGKWLADQSNALYAQLRPNAKNHWIYARLNCTASQKLPKDFYISLGFSGQLSNQNLIPSEQFYIGGFDTVRGYDERELNTDTGLFVRTEVHTPPFRFARCYDKLELLVFFDYGYANNHTPIPPEGKGSHLMSVGPGLRYAFSHYFAARLDYGIQLYHKNFFGSNHQRVHFEVTASY
ncbi:ShlB/FhaC/HecB family hemolysin secretion/activation protein [Candidatus Rhabdochlamydia porcellionis]|jgi:hemolysin activation/secretion protein|uniref:Heme/hemopexin transporter protein HuxB n=1 Tax=Candidatus Rhabdochlamydia porcellionis TaxID=225148 RepID=A0ABX8YZT9_9BACT|nr:ShlB/FhaC/HecB family hemolysin secretion/activation protein [Candidatus Rhabdochlamydia porcellionis]QZA58920.1 Heme/hemopexin transporter protein HuxB [Candidatus Rhabdochlamydia porcellionis]